jgi:hypothetical protein
MWADDVLFIGVCGFVVLISDKEEEGELVAQGMLESVYTEVVDVLSTQSMRAPEVVKGIRESMVW